MADRTGESLTSYRKISGTGRLLRSLVPVLLTAALLAGCAGKGGDGSTVAPSTDIVDQLVTPENGQSGEGTDDPGATGEARTNSADATAGSTDVTAVTPSSEPAATPSAGTEGTPGSTDAVTEDPATAGTQEPAGKTEEASSPSPTGNATATPSQKPQVTPTQQPAVTPTQKPEPTVKPVTDLAAYEPLVISKVYGHGGSTTGVCEYCFIELTNTGSRALRLGGLSLYYKSGINADFVSFALPDVSLGAGRSYLIRGASSAKSSSKYDTSAEVMRLEGYDAEWNITISNNEIRLVLAPSGMNFSKTAQVAELNGKISYFVATNTYYFDTGYMDDYSKNKVAVRVAMKQDSGWQLVNLTKATTEKLNQIVPKTSSGKAATVTGSKLREVRFSVPAGFYTSPVELSITAPSGYSTIFYTTDGSDPTKSSTRKKFTASSPIKLADTTNTPFGSTYRTGLSYVGNIGSSSANMLGGHVIKACGYNGSTYTGVYTNSYFISSKMAGYGVPVMSVTLETNQMFGSPGFYHNFNATTNDPNTRGVAFMEVFDENGTRRGYSNIELSISGHGSSGVGMRSMKVFYKGSSNTTDGTESKLNYDLFDGYARNSKGQNITDFSRLLLRNSGNDVGVSYIRDAYMQRVSRNLNIDTLAYVPVLLFINGDFWGVYNARERYSGDYIQSHYGVDKDNVALVESDYSQVHTNQNAPFIVSSGVENDADHFNALVDYIKSNNMAVTKNYEYVCARMDIDSFIDMYVSRLYFSARDWPENNIKVWRNRTANDRSGFDTKWYFTLLDMDMGISFFTDANNTTENSNFFGWIDATSCVVGNIMHKLKDNAAFRKQFLARFYQVVNEIYVPSWLEEELDVVVAQRRPLLTLQTQRWGASTSTFNTSVNNMRRFVQNRRSYVINYLCSYFGVTEGYLMSISGNYLSVNYPEARLSVRIDNENVTNSWVRKFDKSITVNVTATVKSGYELTAIVFTDSSGKTTRYSGSTARITTSSAGEISFETKKISSGTSLSVHSGIVAGGAQMYYLSPDGKLYAWGSNSNNVLGAGSAPVVTRPALVRENVAQLEVCHSNDMENGNNNIAAAILTQDGDIYVIGAGVIPGLVIGTAWNLVDYSGDPVAISVGLDHLLVLDKDGSVWGIGNNTYGQLGKNGEGGSVTSFVKIAGGAVMISAGRRNSAYVTRNGDCYVLGDGRWNKFNSAGTNITTPYKLLSGVSYISSGEHEMVLVTENGKLYYAGWRQVQGFGQGTGTAGARQISVSGVEKAAIHFNNIAILTENGSLYVYGGNTGNAIGSAVVDGSAARIIASGVKDVAAGYDFIAWMESDGTIKISGSNAQGQAGNGSTSEYVSAASVKIG